MYLCYLRSLPSELLPPTSRGGSLSTVRCHLACGGLVFFNFLLLDEPEANFTSEDGGGLVSLHAVASGQSVLCMLISGSSLHLGRFPCVSFEAHFVWAPYWSFQAVAG